MTTYRTGMTLVAFAVFGAAAGPAMAQAPDGFVAEIIFGTDTTSTHLVITCKPIDVETGKQTKWIDSCNEVGRLAIDQAVDAGLIAPVEGLAFGKGSEFVKSQPAALRSAASLQRELELLREML